MARHFPLLFPLSIAAASLSICVQATPSQAVEQWDWVFIVDPNTRGSGLFVTEDVVPTANTTYSILSISGVYAQSGVPYRIDGLSFFNGSDNIFQWDGNSSSDIIASGNGISFRTSGGFDVNLYSSVGLGPVNTIKRGTQNLNVPLSRLYPELPVPGPLPVFGAAAAFGWSRRLRRRCRTTA